MRPPWNHWLAALALIALGLGAGRAAGNDPPPKPGADTPAEKQPAAPKAEADENRLREMYRGVWDQLQQLMVAKERIARELLTASGSALRKLRDEIDRVATLIADLEAKRAKLEAELRAAEMKRYEAAAKQAEEAAEPHIKIFHLSHLDPNEMASALDTLFPGRARFGAPGRRGGVGGARGGFGVGGPPGGGVAAPGMGGAGGFGGFASPGGFFEGGFGAIPSRLRVAADARTHTLIVRGSDADLQTAADLIAALDRDDGKAAPRLKGARIFRLRYARPQEVQGILNTLEIGARVAALPSARSVVVSGPESALKEAGEVVEAVDAAPPPAPKPGRPDGKH